MKLRTQILGRLKGIRKVRYYSIAIDEIEKRGIHMAFFDKALKGLVDNNWGSDNIRRFKADFVKYKTDYLIKEFRRKEFCTFLIFEDVLGADCKLNEDQIRSVRYKRLKMADAINLFMYHLLSRNKQLNNLITLKYYYENYSKGHGNNFLVGKFELKPDSLLDETLTVWKSHFNKMNGLYSGHGFINKGNKYTDIYIIDKEGLNSLANYVLNNIKEFYTREASITTHHEHDFTTRFIIYFLLYTRNYTDRTIRDFDRGWGHWIINNP